MGTGTSNHVDPEALDFSGEEKSSAHEVNFSVWRHLTQRRTFSPTEQYWTLVHFPGKSVEIPNLLRSRICTEEQIHGVNKDQSVIDEVKRRFPRVHTYHGMWGQVLSRTRPCPDGGIVYLDTMNQVDQKRLKISSTNTGRALMRSGPNTLVCANFCMSSRFKRDGLLSSEDYFRRLEWELLSPNDKVVWKKLAIDLGDGLSDMYLPPKTRGKNTQMGTFFYWNGP